MKIKSWLKWSVFAAAGVFLAGCASYPDKATTREMAEKMVFDAFTASPEHRKRLEQDRSQQICSKIGDEKLTQAESAEIVKLARASIKYPSSGKFTGDWKVGDKLAHNGAGDSPSQQLFLSGANARMPVGRRAALLPAAELRVFRAADGASQGWIGSLGTSFDIRLTGNSASRRLVLSTSGRLRLGHVIVEQGAESGFTGWEAGVALRLETGR
jgi:hypothetical protein